MTFPLSKNSTSHSILNNTLNGLSRVKEQPKLHTALYALESLAKVSGLCLGKSAELDPLVFTLGRGVLTPLDDLIRQQFFLFLKKEENSDSRVIHDNLEDALAALAPHDLPKYDDLMDNLIVCLNIMGFTADDAPSWKKILKRYYSSELLKDNSRQYRDLCSVLRKNLDRVQTPQQAKSFQNALIQCSKDQIQIAEQILNQPLKQRIDSLLGCSSDQTIQRRAEHLQLICNVLLREQYLLNKFAKSFELIRLELRTDEGKLLKNSQLSSTLKQMRIKSYEQLKSLSSISFVYETEIKIDSVNAFRSLPPTKLTDSLNYLNHLHGDDFFDRYQSIFDYIGDVNKKYRDKTENADIAKTALLLSDHVKSLKCTFLFENAMIHYFNLHLQTCGQANCPPGDLEKKISPLLSTIFHFNNASNNLLIGESDSWDLLDFYRKIFAIHLDHQKKQTTIYNAAFSELTKIIQNSKGKSFYKFKKIDVKLPEMAHVLPETLQDLFVDVPKLTLKKEPTLKREKKSLSPLHQKDQNFSQHLTKPQKIKDSQTQETQLLESISKPQKINSTVDNYQKLLKLPTATPFPFKYDQRVMRWNGAELRLDHEFFPEYACASDNFQKKMIDLHAFSQLADYFCSNSFHCNPKVKGKETRCHILPAEFSKGNIRERGYILWAIDKYDCCYHRFFHIDESPAYYEKIVRNTFTEADFPELSLTKEMKPVSAHRFLFKDRFVASNVEFDSFLKIVTIEEIDQNSSLKLFLGKSKLYNDSKGLYNSDQAV